MRCERREQANKVAQCVPGYPVLCCRLVHKNHELTDCGIEPQILQIFGNLLDCLVQCTLNFFAIFDAAVCLAHLEHVPGTVEKSACARQTIGLPDGIRFQWSHK